MSCSHLFFAFWPLTTFTIGIIYFIFVCGTLWNYKNQNVVHKSLFKKNLAMTQIQTTVIGRKKSIMWQVCQPISLFIKGTLSQDFWPLVFLLILSTLRRPWLWGWNVFEKKFEFKKLFDYEVVRSLIGLLRKIFGSSPILLGKFFGVVQYYSEKFLK